VSNNPTFKQTMIGCGLDPVTAPDFNVNAATATALSVNRNWMRFIISFMSQMATDDDYFTEATRDVAQQRILSILSSWLQSV
jgi:hypothetical protein